MTPDAHEEPQTKLHHQQEKKKTSRSQPNHLLRQARKERCWSQADLAEQIGGTNETISRWETGVNTPQPEQLKKLCEAFGKTSAELGYPPGPAFIKIEKAVEVSGSPVEFGPKQRTTYSPRRWSHAIIVGISCLMIVLLVLGAVMLAPLVRATSCGGTFFNSKLDSEWTWIHPGEKATYRLTPAGLTLSAPPHSDLNPLHNNLDAPRLLRPITGNFTIETQLVFRPDTNWQSAGILLWQSPTTFIRFERAFGGKSGMLFQEWDHEITSIMITHLGKYTTTSESVELRIQRQEDHITASWREDSQQDWQPVGDTILHFDTLFIGVDLLDEYNTRQTTSASYSYFRVLCS